MPGKNGEATDDSYVLFKDKRRVTSKSVSAFSIWRFLVVEMHKVTEPFGFMKPRYEPLDYGFSNHLFARKGPRWPWVQVDL